MAEGAQVSWARFEKDEPALADAAVRLHVAGLLDLPEGARVREQHRHPPTAADWVALIGDYTQRCLLASEDPRDERALGAIRRTLPAVGYRLTRAGVRAGESPVDRVLARSESKARAAIEILAAESAELGSRLRALVLCDFQDAGGHGRLADLAGVLQSGSGGARLVLETLLGDPQAAALDPVLLTGRHVACGPECAERLLKWLREAEPGLELAVTAWGDLAEITGPAGWEPRRYVPLVTRFHAEGGSRCLIGTRALLGEGWDAPAVNVVIDLTAATTPTSVVQARGRALRLDAGWPGKVADNWGVVCVTGDHPKGAADFDRFARKHDRYFALAQTGDIVSGVAHVDPRLSPYAPPPDEQFDALNATMLGRAGERDGARERWAIGTPYADEPVATVTVAARRPLGLPAKAAGPLTRRRRRGRTAAAVLAGAILAAILAAAAAAWGGTGPAPAVTLVVAVVLAVMVLAGLAWVGRTARRLAAAPGSGSLDDLAAATADALHAAKLTSRGGDAVRVEAQADGGYRARLQEVPAAESAAVRRGPGRGAGPAQPAPVRDRPADPAPAVRPGRGGPAGRPPPGHRARAGHRRLPRRAHRAERQQEAGSGVRASLEHPGRPGLGGLRRLARGHRHPGRPARRRPVRPHHPDPHPVAVRMPDSSWAVCRPVSLTRAHLSPASARERGRSALWGRSGGLSSPETSPKPGCSPLIPRMRAS